MVVMRSSSVPAFRVRPLEIGGGAYWLCDSAGVGGGAHGDWTDAIRGGRWAAQLLNAVDRTQHHTSVDWVYTPPVDDRMAGRWTTGGQFFHNSNNPMCCFCSRTAESASARLCLPRSLVRSLFHPSPIVRPSSSSERATRRRRSGLMAAPVPSARRFVSGRNATEIARGRPVIAPILVCLPTPERPSSNGDRTQQQQQSATRSVRRGPLPPTCTTTRVKSVRQTQTMRR